MILALLAAAGPALADYDALVEARAAASAGDAKKALAAIARIDAREVCAPDLLFEEASLLAADVLEKTAPADAAARLLALPPDGARLARAAALLRAASQEARALAVEVTLLTTVVDHPESRALAKRLGAEGIAQRLDVDQRMARVRALLETHVSREANDEARRLAKAVGGDHAYACELGYIIGKAERKMRRYRPAIIALADARQRCDAAKNEAFARRSALLEIQVRGIRGEIHGTTRVAKWLEKQDPKHSFVDDAWVVVAEVLERREKPDEAKAVYERIRKMDGDQRSMAAWRLAFDAIEANDAKAALPLLAQIIASNPARASETARAHYWTYRLDPKQADAALDALVKRPSFYTWLALDRLEREDAERAKKLKARVLAQRGGGQDVDAPIPEAWAATIARAKTLAERSEPALATAELAILEGRGPEGDRIVIPGAADGATCWAPTDAQAYVLARAYHEVGAYPEAQLVLRSRHHLFDALAPDNAHVWRTAYSRAYESEIRDAATKAKVEPWFLMGLAREESTFDPEIVSWAGAVGLAQLMPPTAVGAYAEVFKGRLDIEDTERLKDPALNLRLGAHVLKQGLSRFGSEPLALAAYNGGPGLTARALPKAPMDFDRWVETIPVKETRRYVKRVTETWGLYRLLYDSGAPFVDLPDMIRP